MAARLWFQGRLGTADSSFGLFVGASYGDGSSGGLKHGHNAKRATWLTSDGSWEVLWQGGALAKIY